MRAVLVSLGVVLALAAGYLAARDAGWLVAALLAAFLIVAVLLLVLYWEKVEWPEKLAGLAVALMLAIPPACISRHCSVKKRHCAVKTRGGLDPATALTPS